VLQVGAVYSVWIDITNVFVGDRIYPDNYDTYNVYLQKEGDPGRTLVFANFTSDRDLLSNDPLTGGTPTDTLGRVYIGGNSDPDSALFDDFYLSKSGYNSTVPRAVGYAGPAPTVAIQWNGAQWQVVFQGKLEEATSVAGPWTVVTGATSPHLISATGADEVLSRRLQLRLVVGRLVGAAGSGRLPRLFEACREPMIPAMKRISSRISRRRFLRRSVTAFGAALVAPDHHPGFGIGARRRARAE
jgi:hypothetical protein